MWRRARAVAVIIGVATAAGWLAPPAFADQGDDPCPLSLSLMCRFLPIAPDLDGDVDLTKDQPVPDPQAPVQPAIDPCAITRCI